MYRMLSYAPSKKKKKKPKRMLSYAKYNQQSYIEMTNGIIM